MDDIWRTSYPLTGSFNYQDLSLILQNKGYFFSNETIRKKLKRAVDLGELLKLGRNCFCIPNERIYQYKPVYSSYAEEIANIIHDEYPYMDFSLFELFQLNEFINHQIAHNAIFVAVESDTSNFVFDTLKEAYPGKVLILPNEETYHQYWSDNMIVIIKLVSQRPVLKQNRWQIRIETLLVDLFADPLLKNIISESEYPTILEQAFHRYIIDKNSLFRYAKRRTADKRLQQIIEKKLILFLGQRRRMSEFDDFLHELLKDPSFRAEYENLKDEYNTIQALIDARKDLQNIKTLADLKAKLMKDESFKKEYRAIKSKLKAAQATIDSSENTTHST